MEQLKTSLNFYPENVQAFFLLLFSSFALFFFMHLVSRKLLKPSFEVVP